VKETRMVMTKTRREARLKIMYYSKKFNLKPGDRIIVPKSGLRIIQHHVIYLGLNMQGQELFVENQIGFGVRAIEANTFFKDVLEVTKIILFKGNNYERKTAVQIALKKIGKPYDLINYNCEHFANEIQNGYAESGQVENLFSTIKLGIGALVVIGILGLITNE
jgi:uncharacterized protein YycO